MSADQSRGPTKETPAFPSLGDFDIRIARDGTWFHEGRPIRRLPLVKLFATVLRRDDEGIYWLQTPVEKGKILVEDAPFVAVELSVKGNGRDQSLCFRTNLGDWVEADAEHPLRLGDGAKSPESAESGGPSPYILVREGLEARILRPVYYHLADLVVAAPVNLPGCAPADCLGVWSKGVFFPLGKAA